MMRKKRTLTAILSLAFCFSMLFAMSATASAAHYTGSNANSIYAFRSFSFDNTWQLYHSGDSGRASLTYGYRTGVLDKDYASANHSTKTHYAMVSRVGGSGEGGFNGPSKSAGTISKKEITHMSPEVFYHCVF